MAEEDNFDIDIYGDDAQPDYTEPVEMITENHTDAETRSTTLDGDSSYKHSGSDHEQHAENGASEDQKPADVAPESQNGTQAIGSTAGDTSHSGPPKQAPVQQGVKRKEGMTDDREVAPNATNALLVGDLHWYQDEDDVRGWANQAGVEDEVVEVTFNEHKVNGKSKG